MTETDAQRVYHLLDPHPDELLTPRRFLREAEILIHDVKKRKKEKRYFFLFHNGMFMCQPLKGGRHKLLAFMNFDKKNLELENPGDELLFRMRSTTTGAEFEFIFNTADDREIWYSDIELAMSGAAEMVDPGAIVEGPYDPYNEQNSEQKAIFDQLKNKLLTEYQPPLSERQIAWLDDSCICRFLRARQYNINKTWDMITNTLRWREEVKPDEIKAEEIESEASLGKCYVSHGRDIYHRPIVYMRPGKDTKTNVEVKVKFVMFFLEQASIHMRTMETGIEKMTWIVDFSHSQVGAPDSDTVRLARETLTIVQDHYPERLGQLFLLNPPFIFWAFWKVLHPFVDPTTRKKIQFLKKGAEYKKMLLYIRPENLEEMYGGTMQYTYNHEEWKQEFMVGREALASASSSNLSNGSSSSSSSSS